MLGPTERGALIGKTGSGKSYLAQRLLPPESRLCIIDPKRMFKAPKDCKVFDNPKKILFSKPDRFVYRPSISLLDNMEAYNQVYKYAYTKGNFFIYTDDVVGIMDKTKYPNYYRICYQMGRERRVSMLSAFQRPAWVPRFILTEAEKFYIFRLIDLNDIKRIQEVTGQLPIETIAAGKYRFAYFDVITMENPIVTIIGGK